MDLDPLGSETPFSIYEDEYVPSATQLHSTPTPPALRSGHQDNFQIDQTPPQSEHSGTPLQEQSGTPLQSEPSGTPLQSMPTPVGVRRSSAVSPNSRQRARRARDPEAVRENNRRADANRTPAQTQQRAQARNQRRDERRQQHTLQEAADDVLLNLHHEAVHRRRAACVCRVGRAVPLGGRLGALH